MSTTYRTFIVVAPGLESLLESELSAFDGLRKVTPGPGGVECTATVPGLWELALKTRLGEGVRIRIGQFRAFAFPELIDRLTRLPWHAYLPRNGRPPVIRVSCRKSRLYHSDAVAQRVGQVLAERRGLAGLPDPANPGVFLRIERDDVVVSIDAGGTDFFRRGYRTDVGLAPLRETLAAACIVANRDGDPVGGPVWDPFCGSGTIPIEAALMRPGTWSRRPFAFERWPNHNRTGFEEFTEHLPESPAPSTGHWGSDRDGRVLAAARRNADRAGAAKSISFVEGDFEEVAERIPKGTRVVSNLPYGKRLRADLGDVGRRFGRMLRSRPDLRPATVLVGHRSFERDTGLNWTTVATVNNRGTPVRLLSLNRVP